MDKKTEKRRIILVTDGDTVARKAVEKAAQSIGGRCISASAGNPTPVSGEQIVRLIKQAKHDPVVVMFDDNGSNKRGQGEKALDYVANHPDLEVMGVLAVASNCGGSENTAIDCAITNEKHLVFGGVDKDGNLVSEEKVITGDTVNVVDDLHAKNGTYVVGVGDIGKMQGHDSPYTGAEVTTKALQKIIDHWETSNTGG